MVNQHTNQLRIPTAHGLLQDLAPLLQVIADAPPLTEEIRDALLLRQGVEAAAEDLQTDEQGLRYAGGRLAAADVVEQGLEDLLRGLLRARLLRGEGAVE